MIAQDKRGYTANASPQATARGTSAAIALLVADIAASVSTTAAEPRSWAARWHASDTDARSRSARSRACARQMTSSPTSTCWCARARREVRLEGRHRAGQLQGVDHGGRRGGDVRGGMAVIDLVIYLWLGRRLTEGLTLGMGK